MVSLNNTRGGFFFTESASQVRSKPLNRNEASVSVKPQKDLTRPRALSGAALLLDGSSIGSTTIRQNTRNPFKHILTGYISMFELTILIVYSIVCFVDIIGLEASSKFERHIFTNKISFYSLLHVFLWIFVYIFDRIIQHSHQKMRRRGYLKFYLRLRNIRRIPFIVFSFGIAALLLIFTLQHQLCLIMDSKFSFDYFILVIVGCEAIMSSSALVFYIIVTLKFNHDKPPPDTIGNDSEIVVPFLSPPPDIGFSRDDETENVEELLDKQADMIRYLKAHNANLGKKIIELQNKLPQPQIET